ncbi:MAG: FecR domain-containing protein [Cyclobacteriaceae bacterium]
MEDKSNINAEFTEQELNELEEVILKTQIDVDAAWDKQKQTVEDYEADKASKTFRWKSFLRVAAVLLLIAVVGGVVYNRLDSDAVSIRTTAGEETIEILPDGSKIYLNENSSISFEDDFGVTERQVTLNGEGFFEVERDEEHPFVVSLSNGDEVRVLGTSFNIKIEEFGAVNLLVESGRVEYTRASNYEDKRTLVKGDFLTTGAGSVRVNKNKENNLISWKTKQVIFDERSLKDVFETLSAVYKKKIVYNPELSNCLLTAEFDNRPVDEVIGSISSIFNLSFSIEENTISIVGKGCAK